MFSREVLAIDAPAVVERITRAIVSQVRGTLRRRGVVVGLSGGVDSSVVAALCARALGPGRVLGLFMPERDSSDDSLRLGQLLAAHLGIATIIENIGPTLAAAGCYQRQIEAIRQVFPEYGEGWKCKLTLPSILDSDRLNVFQLTVESPGESPAASPAESPAESLGESFGDAPGGSRTMTSRMSPAAYLQLVAATNFKQRVRKNMEYYHADRLMYAVAGTPNRLEYDQGFFVKNGDGSADFKPIAHLYKTQVYELAACLGLPEEIRTRPPTTDTFSMAQTQEEFYFSLPYREMDLCLYAHNHGVPAAEIAPALGLTAAQVERVYRDIEAKRRTTQYLHLGPLFVDKVSEISSMPAETSDSPAHRA